MFSQNKKIVRDGWPPSSLQKIYRSSEDIKTNIREKGRVGCDNNIRNASTRHSCYATHGMGRRVTCHSFAVLSHWLDVAQHMGWGMGGCNIHCMSTHCWSMLAWTWNWKFWLPLQAWNWKFWSPQIRINGLATFYQRQSTTGYALSFTKCISGISS